MEREKEDHDGRGNNGKRERERGNKGSPHLKGMNLKASVTISEIEDCGKTTFAFTLLFLVLQFLLLSLPFLVLLFVLEFCSHSVSFPSFTTVLFHLLLFLFLPLTPTSLSLSVSRFILFLFLRQALIVVTT